MVQPVVHDAVIIGGGFYGAAIAVYLKKQRGFRRVLLIEQDDSLLSRASYNNQARVHNGYHYPRSFTTAYRSRVNMPRFLRDWPDAVPKDFVKLYAIARRNSKVTARQFDRFCRQIGARIEPAEPAGDDEDKTEGDDKAKAKVKTGASKHVYPWMRTKEQA